MIPRGPLPSDGTPQSAWRAAVLPLLLLAVVSSAVAEEPRPVPGLRGAIRIPFTMPCDGEATLAIYTPYGRLVRPLAQVLPLTRGEYVANWDGMDLWGNLLPAGTEVEVRVYTGPGVKAFWEFGIASPNAVPWPTKPFGEGDAMRAGGWLGDHGVSAAAVAVGDRLYFGSTMAEHGHTVISCNLAGEKMWGRPGLDGWVGPSILASDGTAIYGLVKDTQIFRMSLDGLDVKRIADTKENRVRGLAAHAGRVTLTLDNHAATGSVVDVKLGGKDIAFKECRPIPSSAQAYNRNLTGEEQFAACFREGGHPQAGVDIAGKGASRGVLVRFRKPVEIGTLLVERLPMAVSAEFHALAPGTAYDAVTMVPEPGEEPGPMWRPIGSSDLARRVNAVTCPPGTTTEAVYIRLEAVATPVPEKWPRLVMCRVLPKRLERVDPPGRVILPSDTRVDAPPADVRPGDAAWAFHVEAPVATGDGVPVVIDYGKPVSFDAVVLHNSLNHATIIEAWTAAGPPEIAAAAGWRPIAERKAAVDKVVGSKAASPHANDARLTLAEPVTTRALRLRAVDGMRGGRWNNPPNAADHSLVRTDDVVLLKLLDGRSADGRMILRVIDGGTGETVLESNDASVDMTALAFAPDGTLYSLAGDRLRRTELPRATNGAVRHESLAADGLVRPRCLAVAADGGRIAVGDPDANTVFLFDPQGRRLGTIGGIGPRKPGPWDSRTVDDPGAVAFASDGKVWVCERTYTPKRITRYAPDGRPEQEFLGPPHYGGGGAISCDLKSFWYEACEYEVDFASGTSRLVALNDVQSNIDTATLETNSYAFTKLFRPIDHAGRRYLVADAGAQFSPGFVVTIHEPATKTVKPAAILATAKNSAFLVREGKAWRSHWLAQDLEDSSYIWCDLNDDGRGQVEEVQLFKNEAATGDAKRPPFEGPYWGSFAGADLTFWGPRARLAPTRFTPGGAPVYERQAIQPFDYERLAAVYPANTVFSTRAATGFGGVGMVAADGSLVLTGQPYVIGPDLQIKGGPPETGPSEFMPRIVGKVVDNPLSFTGSGPTKGDVAEVAMINGVNGRWAVWGVQEGVMLGEIFTGRDGGFGEITHPKRGMDLTGRKNDYETFFGYFTTADDGKHYAISGRGHFGLCRIEGLDAIRVAKSRMTVAADTVAANVSIRKRLVGERTAKREKRELAVKKVSVSAPGFTLDGRLGEWEKNDADSLELEMLEPLDAESGTRFAAAWDERNLTLAFSGTVSTANANQDWKYLFKTGFAFDVLVRPNEKDGDDRPRAGDRRIVVGPTKAGTWVAVLYEPVVPDAAEDAGVTFASPVAATRIDRVVNLGADDCTVAFVPGDPWTAEMQVSWTALGVKPQAKRSVRMDFGILVPTGGGTEVDSRHYWANPATGDVGDLAVEAEIKPATWGTVTLE